MVMSSNKIGRRAMKATQTGIDDILKSAQTSARATVESDMKADDTIKKATAPQKAQSFAEAFKAARADKGAGKTFTFGGKSYSTNMAGEGLKRPTSTPVRASTPKATAPETNTRAQTELSRTATRSQKAIRENRAENQADFRKRMQEKRSGNASTSTSSTGPRDNSAAGRRARFADMLGAPGRFAASLYTGVPSGKTPPMGKRNPILKVGDEAREANKGTIGGMKKGGKVKKYAGGGSIPPQPTAAERAASKAQDERLKKVKVTTKEGKVVDSANRSEGSAKRFAKGGVTKEMPSSNQMGSMGMAKGGMFRASANGIAKKGKTKASMPKMAGGGNCYAKGGSIDGIAQRGKTRAPMRKGK